MQTDTLRNEVLVITMMKLSSNLFAVASFLFLVGAHSQECQYQDDCNPEWSNLCKGLGATCESSVATNGKRHDLCRWDLVFNRETCERNTLGIWTPLASTYARNVPCAVKGARQGACITEVSNVDCDCSLNHRCRKNGGICERMRSNSGDTAYVCRWLDYDAIECADKTEAGIWTTREEDYGQLWESLFYNGGVGACVRDATSNAL